KRVTGKPVLFWKRRLIDNVPFAEFGPIAVVSRTRFGLPAAPLVESSRNATTFIVYRGLPRFCGPGAPNRRPITVAVAFVSAKMKSSALTFESWVNPPVGQLPNVDGLPFLPHSSRK